MWNLDSVEWAPLATIPEALQAGCNLAGKAVR